MFPYYSVVFFVGSLKRNVCCREILPEAIHLNILSVNIRENVLCEGGLVGRILAQVAKKA